MAAGVSACQAWCVPNTTSDRIQLGAPGAAQMTRNVPLLIWRGWNVFCCWMGSAALVPLCQAACLLGVAICCQSCCLSASIGQTVHGSKDFRTTFAMTLSLETCSFRLCSRARHVVGCVQPLTRWAFWPGTGPCFDALLCAHHLIQLTSMAIGARSDGCFVRCVLALLVQWAAF